MPYNVDGTTPISWSVRRINFRVSTVETASSAITLQKSVGTGIFNAVALGSLTLSGSLYETTTGSLATINSGDKMRFYVDTLGSAQNWTITAEISNP
jgi:phosphotransferase system IIA component